MLLALVFSCTDADDCPAGHRTDALQDSLWNHSVWISAADAPVATGYVPSECWHSADGASWFATVLKNRSKVVSAKWMTTGLGVYDIYVNGRLIGEEFLKPGYTHYLKTKYSFTYDVTDALDSGSGKENIFAAQVTPLRATPI